MNESAIGESGVHYNETSKWFHLHKGLPDEIKSYIVHYVVMVSSADSDFLTVALHIKAKQPHHWGQLEKLNKQQIFSDHCRLSSLKKKKKKGFLRVAAAFWCRQRPWNEVEGTCEERILPGWHTKSPTVQGNQWSLPDASQTPGEGGVTWRAKEEGGGGGHHGSTQWSSRDETTNYVVSLFTWLYSASIWSRLQNKNRLQKVQSKNLREGSKGFHSL